MEPEQHFWPLHAGV